MDLQVLSEKLKHPIGSVAENHKKNLLLYSLLGFAVTKIGLMPEKISFIGVSLKENEQNSLLILLALVIAYFFISFLVAIWSDLLAWQALFVNKRSESLLSNNRDFFKSVKELPKEMLLDQMRQESKLLRRSKITFYVYLFTNFFVPIIVGVSCFYLVFTRI